VLRATLEVPSEALLHPQKLKIIGGPIVVRLDALLIFCPSKKEILRSKDKAVSEANTLLGGKKKSKKNKSSRIKKLKRRKVIT